MKLTQKAQKESIQKLLEINDRAVERALIRIYERQTLAEQNSEETHDHNGVGFTAFDAEFLSSCAKGLMRYGHLTANQMPVVRKRMMKYWRQLASIAQAKGREIKPVEELRVLVAAKSVVEQQVDLSVIEHQMDLLVHQAEIDEDRRVAAYKRQRDGY